MSGNPWNHYLRHAREMAASSMQRTLAAICTLMLALATGCSEPDRPSISLFLAVQRGDLNQLERHIHWGSDIDVVQPNGLYPLHVAAEKGRIVLVETLLDHGATLDQTTADGDSPLDLAILAGRTQIADLLLEHGADLKPTALLLKAAAASVTDRDIVRFLIAQGADTEQRNGNGDTPLLIAIRGNNHRLAAHLVQQGADVNVQDAQGESALVLAGRLGEQNLLSLLRRQGAR